jgi:hypothetical protein
VLGGIELVASDRRRVDEAISGGTGAEPSAAMISRRFPSMHLLYARLSKCQLESYK